MSFFEECRSKLEESDELDKHESIVVECRPLLLESRLITTQRKLCQLCIEDGAASNTAIPEGRPGCGTSSTRCLPLVLPGRLGTEVLVAVQSNGHVCAPRSLRKSQRLRSSRREDGKSHA